MYWLSTFHAGQNTERASDHLFFGQWPRGIAGMQARFAGSIAQMTLAISTEAAIADLARVPLRHTLLLKQLLAYPGHVKAFRVAKAAGSAILLTLEASASAYDRQTYPEAGRGGVHL